ncbi:MAG: hypothetical protein JW997_03635, partial [Actinobacteria bacterium]|nr:hypothetical protein [Actinomycetota bacterium]
MRIGIDISTVLNHGADIGAGRYIFNLLKNLFEINRQDTFVLTGRYVTDDYMALVEELKKDYLKAVWPDNDNKAGAGLEFFLFKTTAKKL